jgi:hypothetical protein
VAAALEGVDRAFLVSSAFANLQFERETDFLDLVGAAYLVKAVPSSPFPT